jgi:hypothetical protein
VHLALAAAPGQTFAELAGRLAHLPGVAASFPNRVRRIAALPNDPRFPEQWGLHNTGQVVDDWPGRPDADMDAAEAWDSPGSRGEGAVAAVIDTGITFLHEDLEPSLWTNPGEIAGNGRDDDGNGYVDDIFGADLIRRTGLPLDDHGHGTHVSGVVAAAADNALGMAGVAPGGRIMSLKAFDARGEGSDADIIAALDYLLAMKDRGVPVAAALAAWNGFGGAGGEPLELALEAAGQAGVAVVAAAGNDRADLDLDPVYPAAYRLPNLVTVAASDPDDSLAWFSNRGVTTVHLAAPGVSILGPVPGSDPAAPGTGYALGSGSSLAAAHVTGAILCLAGRHPGDDVLRRLGRLLAGVDRLPTLAWETVTGGRLNLAAALAGTGPPLPLVSAASPDRGAVPGQTVTLTGSGFGAEMGRIYLADGTSPDLRTPRVRLRFLLVSDCSYRQGGVQLDDVWLGSPDVFFDDFESGNLQWTHGGVNDTWSLSDEAAWSGTHAWSDSPGANYADQTWSHLTLERDVDLSALDAVTVGFTAMVDLEEGYDHLYVQISPDGGGWWLEVGRVTGSPGVWKEYQFTITPPYLTPARITSWRDGEVRFQIPFDHGRYLPGRHVVLKTAEGLAAPVAGPLDAWEARSPNLVSRFRGALAAVSDRLWLLGGAAGSDTDTIEIYQPGKDVWSSSSDLRLPVSRSGSAAAVLDGRIYVAGGFDLAAGRLDSLDPTTGHWRSESPLPVQVALARLVALDGALYLMGGYTYDPVLRRVSIQDGLWRYTPRTGAWEPRRAMSVPRTSFAAVAHRGRIYVLGGYADQNFQLTWSGGEIYDPATDAWTPDPAFSLGGGAQAAASDGRRIYYSGGLQMGTVEASPLLVIRDTVDDDWDLFPGTISERRPGRVESGLAHLPGRGLYLLGGTVPWQGPLRDLVRLDVQRLYHQVTILSPDGGELPPPGSRITISWGGPIRAHRFRLEYAVNGKDSWRPIVARTRRTAVRWRVPPSVAPGDHLLFRVTGFTRSGRRVGTDVSDAPAGVSP